MTGRVVFFFCCVIPESPPALLSRIRGNSRVKLRLLVGAVMRPTYYWVGATSCIRNIVLS
jgi:hypothetical protein